MRRALGATPVAAILSEEGELPEILSALNPVKNDLLVLSGLTADKARRAWLPCPNCRHDHGCHDCKSERNCSTHWQYLLSNQGKEKLRLNYRESWW